MSIKVIYRGWNGNIYVRWGFWARVCAPANNSG